MKAAAVMTSMASDVLSLVYPRTCVLGGDVLTEGELSADAHESLRHAADEPCCFRCAARVGPGIVTETGCDVCRDRRFHIDQAIRLGSYRDEIKDAILRMKHVSNGRIARVLGDVLADIREVPLRDFHADLVTFVPLHWRTRWARGYNQAGRLAERIARRLDIPLRSNILRKVRATLPQHRLSATRRRENIRAAFQATKSLSDARIILVDDVLTTGATCDQAAVALKNAGTASVLVVVLARVNERGDH